jgi:hypothetical protein
VAELQWRLGEQARKRCNAAHELLELATELERPGFGAPAIDEYHAKLAEHLRMLAAALDPGR